MGSSEGKRGYSKPFLARISLKAFARGKGQYTFLDKISHSLIIFYKSKIPGGYSMTNSERTEKDRLRKSW